LAACPPPANHCFVIVIAIASGTSPEDEHSIVHLDDGDAILADVEVAAHTGLQRLAAKGSELPGMSGELLPGGDAIAVGAVADGIPCPGQPVVGPGEVFGREGRPGAGEEVVEPAGVRRGRPRRPRAWRR
jgi:hypothetical protein